MNKLTKTIVASGLVLAATSAATFAEGFDLRNAVAPHHIYNSATGGTVPGLEVTANGQKTVYQMGDLGLTRDIIFDDSGDKMEAWAQSALGVAVTADVSLYAPDASDK